MICFGFKNKTLKSDLTLKNYIDFMIIYIENLSVYPFLGKFLFYLDNLEIRQLIFKQHRIIYAIKNNTVFIISIVHTSRNIISYIQYLKNNMF